MNYEMSLLSFFVSCHAGSGFTFRLVLNLMFLVFA